MKKIYLIALTVVPLALVSSCKINCVHGSGHSATEKHTVNAFSRIQISGAFKVNLKQDSSKTVTVTGDDNLLKYIHVDNDGDELHIYSKRSFCDARDIVLNIGVGKLSEIKASGAVAVNSDGQLTTGDINLHFTGASSINLDLNAANVTTEGTGATDLNLKGQATSHHITLSGQGDVHAFDFVVGSYNIESSGAADCEVNVLKSLEVHTSGASDVKYKGNPSTVNTDKSGAGSVTKVN